MKGRVVFMIHLKPGREDDFLKAYDSIRHEVARGVKGHLMDQVCQSADDPLSWAITSEWDSLEAFREWERTPEHRDLVKPMRDCWDQAKSLKYQIRLETAHHERS